jgi:hydrogenase nickel incorporation protein HypA/HybF
MTPPWRPAFAMMPEVDMCEAILRTVEDRAAGRRVSEIQLRIGLLHEVSPASLRAAFSLVAAGTVADHARLDVVLVPAERRCRHCGQLAQDDARCRYCGSTEIGIDGGDDIVVESILLTP